MDYVFVSEGNFDKARKAIRSADKENKKAIFSSNDDELSRKILEKEPLDTLLIKVSGRKDRMKQRDSGFNQVLAKIAKKQNVSIGIDLDEIILSKTKKEKAQILARVKQNISLCAKNKVKMKFISQRSKKNSYDLKALGLSLGMPTWMTKNLNIPLN